MIAYIFGLLQGKYPNVNLKSYTETAATKDISLYIYEQGLKAINHLTPQEGKKYLMENQNFNNE